MQISFFDVFVSVFALIVLAVPGFLFAKFKMLPKTATESLSTIVLYGCQSLLVFMSFQGYRYTSEIGKNMLIVAGLSTAVHLIMIVLVSVIFRSNDAKIKCLKYGSVFGNCGFMGIPFLKMLFSSSPYLGEVLIYTAVVLIVFNVLSWTLGVLLITGDIRQISVKKIAFNPVIISAVLGVLLFVTIKKPIVELAEVGTNLYAFLSRLMASLQSIGDAVTPLSMMVIGIKLAGVNFKKLFTNKLAYLCCFLKLVVSAIVSILVVAFLPVSSAIKYTVFLLLSMPSATATSLFAIKFNGDAEFGSVCVMLTTILSIIAIPLMFLAFYGIFGITL